MKKYRKQTNNNCARLEIGTLGQDLAAITTSLTAIAAHPAKFEILPGKHWCGVSMSRTDCWSCLTTLANHFEELRWQVTDARRLLQGQGASHDAIFLQIGKKPRVRSGTLNFIGSRRS